MVRICYGSCYCVPSLEHHQCVSCCSLCPEFWEATQQAGHAAENEWLAAGNKHVNAAMWLGLSTGLRTLGDARKGVSSIGRWCVLALSCRTTSYTKAGGIYKPYSSRCSIFLKSLALGQAIGGDKPIGWWSCPTQGDEFSPTFLLVRASV